MNLIYDRGLNCHLASIISIAASLGIPHKNAFATLWSETDFIDEPIHNVYISGRVYANLEALGTRREALRCASPEEAGESLSLIDEKELFLIGMDSFHTPWSPVYQYFYSPHYFFARKEDADTACCFDPVYNREYQQMRMSDIQAHAYDLNRVHRIAAEPLKAGLWEEASEILRLHPGIQETLLTEIEKCKGENRHKMSPVIKQITAMLNNRYLFQQYLRTLPPALGCDEHFFDQRFFMKWEAVKNGLYKASILRDNRSVIDEVCGLFMDAVREETALAEKIIRMGQRT